MTKENRNEKNNLTEVVFVLDRSGSMANVTDDTIGGFNSLLAQQQKTAGQVYLTTMLFDDRFDWLHDHLDIKHVKPITDREYYPRGCTALYDAVGMTIRKLDNITKSEHTDKVLFVIITDGMENASHEYEGGTIRKMIEAHQEKGWEFMFLGANIDSFKVAGNLGFRKDRVANWVSDGLGMKTTMNAVSQSIAFYAEESCMREAPLASVNEDYKKRGFKKH